MASRVRTAPNVTFIAGLVAGSILGGALAVLLAPEPSEEMRAHLRSRAARLRERTRSIGETGLGLLRQPFARG